MNTFLGRLRGRDPVLMLAIRSSRTADVVRIAKSTGHHAVMVDLEHSTMPLDIAASLCATAGDLGLFPFVRVRERDYGTLGPLLDGGAQGIVAPRVETAAEAATIARACRFAPRGQRSQLATVPLVGMRPTPAATLNPALDEATIAAILIETRRRGKRGRDRCGRRGRHAGVRRERLHRRTRGARAVHRPPRDRGGHRPGRSLQRYDKPLMVGGISDQTLLRYLDSLGACPLRLTGTDTDMLYAGAAARAERFGS